VVAIEKDDDTIITASGDKTLKEWHTTSCECIRTHSVKVQVSCMIKTRNGSSIVCGLNDGSVERRRLKRMRLVSSFAVHMGEVVSICELSDRTFVSSASNSNVIKRWNKKGRVLVSFDGHISRIDMLMELRSNIVVSASEDGTMRLWNVASGHCICTIAAGTVTGLIKLSEDTFATGDDLHEIRVWDHHGRLVEGIRTDFSIQRMMRVGDTIVCASNDRLEMRRIK